MKWFLVLLAVFTLAGCGVNVGNNDEPVTFLHGVPAKEYYNRFLYKKVDGDLPYRYLSNSHTKLKTIDATTNLYFTAALFLLAENKYVFDYEELAGIKHPDGTLSLTSIHKSRKRGTWKVSSAALELDGVGEGAGMKQNESDVLWLKFDRAIHSPELKDKSDFFFYTSSNQGMPEGR